MPTYETSLLTWDSFETNEYYCVKYFYTGTTYYSDGTSVEFKRPAHDMPIPMPVYKLSIEERVDTGVLAKLLAAFRRD